MQRLLTACGNACKCHCGDPVGLKASRSLRSTGTLSSPSLSSSYDCYVCVCGIERYDKFAREVA
eukprot:6403272-Amphidinium_carterae.1